MTKKELVQQLKAETVKFYEAKEAQFPDKEHLREAERVILLKVIDRKWMDHIDDMEQFRELERVILLKVIDRKWMDHIDDMDQLRQGIGVQAYGQRDPLTEYKFQGFEMFANMTAAISEDTVKVLMNMHIEQKIEREQVAKVTGTNRDDSVAKEPVKRADKKVQPNDLCPCGSGLKYKKCCGKNA